MRKIIAAVLATFLFCGVARADAKLTDEESAKVTQALTAWGCEGGTFQKETEASGVIEADDVKCKSGQYDFRLDREFNVIAILRD